jgi:hypothetical protein
MKTKRSLIGLSVLVLAVVVVMLRRGSPAEGLPAGHETTEAAPAPEAVVRRGKAPAVPAGARPDLPPKAGVTIDDVRFEKTSVCRGEENLVTVVAHSADPADDKWLRVEINRVPGDRVPLRTYMADEPDLEPYFISRRVVVRGRAGAFATTELPQPPARDCLRPQELLVSAEPEPYSGGQVRLRAQLLHQREDAAPSVARFRWIFGDGAEVETAEPTVVHDYSGRAQDRLVTTFLVTGEATLSNDTVVRGRVAVTLENPLFVAAQGGPVTLIAEPGEPTESGQEIRLRHGARKPLVITRLVRRSLLDATDATPVEDDVLAPGALGAAEIPPRGLTTRLSLPARREVIAEEYQVDAVTAGGEPVSAKFYVRRPGAEPRLLARLRAGPGPEL